MTASSILFPLITFPYVSRVLLPVGNGKIRIVGDSDIWNPDMCGASRSQREIIKDGTGDPDY